MQLVAIDANKVSYNICIAFFLTLTELKKKKRKPPGGWVQNKVIKLFLSEILNRLGAQVEIISRISFCGLALCLQPPWILNMYERN